MALLQIVYVSSASFDFNDQELVELLQVSREKNARRGITGFLMYCNQSFMQVIEGEEERITTLYSELLVDHRHHRLIKVSEKTVASCQYGDWSMAFRRVDNLSTFPEVGFSTFLENVHQVPPELPQDAELATMINAFRLSAD